MDNLGTFDHRSIDLRIHISIANSFKEWSDGYGPRFGVTYTDYKTLERTPKNSALMLKHMFAERQTNGHNGHTNGLTNGKVNGHTNGLEAGKNGHV